MKKQIASVKKFWADHQTKILATTTVLSVLVAVGMRAGLDQHDEFLKEHDLFDEYYRPEE
jgi:hypothetical protein